MPGSLVGGEAWLGQGCTDDGAGVEKALDGHLCRCTGYARIIDAIQTAGEAWNNGGSVENKKPRRHFYFCEEFGASRNPAFSKENNANGNGVGRSSLRHPGIDQTLGR